MNKYSLCCSVSMRRGTLSSPIRGYPQGRYPDMFQTHSICQSAHHQGCHITLGWTETHLWFMLTDFKLVCRVFIILHGAESLLGTDCVCVSHELLKYVDQHLQLNSQWVMISSIIRTPIDAAGGWQGTNGMGRPCWLESHSQSNIIPNYCLNWNKTIVTQNHSYMAWKDFIHSLCSNLLKIYK